MMRAICSALSLGSSSVHHERSPQAVKPIDMAKTLSVFKPEERNSFLFINREHMIKGEPKQQVQYTMSVEKVMNLYVYWSVSTVKSFGCCSYGRWVGLLRRMNIIQSVICFIMTDGAKLV